MSTQSAKETFLRSAAFGVVGASNDRGKFGNRVLRKYWQHGMRAYPVNPHESQIEGQAVFAKVSDLPAEVKSLSIITQPSVTEKIVEDAIAHGIKNIWIQPGAESARAVQRAKAAGMTVIANGPCILVELG